MFGKYQLLVLVVFVALISGNFLSTIFPITSTYLFRYRFASSSILYTAHKGLIILAGSFNTLIIQEQQLNTLEPLAKISSATHYLLLNYIFFQTIILILFSYTNIFVRTFLFGRYSM